MEEPMEEPLSDLQKEYLKKGKGLQPSPYEIKNVSKLESLPILLFVRKEE